MSDQGTSQEGEREQETREWQNQAAPRKTLYEALQENKEKRKEEHDQKFAQRNTYHRLDSREVEHLENLRKKEQRREEELKFELAKGLEKMKKKTSDSAESKKVSYIPVKLKKSKSSKGVQKPTQKAKPAKSKSPTPTSGLPLIDYDEDEDD
ncbi:hypothetical protein TRVA0_044S00606 [Trichomonascus vanleenenianus]|uniref:uncharacterized protein n=1 Tax=Trichomonascus vanleenenianus TaxID=2268995 RepID=UPI003ECAD0DD